MPHRFKPVRCCQNIKKCVVSGWHSIPLDARVRLRITMDELFIELERLAKEATVSEWCICEDVDDLTKGTHIMTTEGYAIAGTWGEGSEADKQRQNALYIAAANPLTILALINQNKRLKIQNKI